MRPQIGIYKYYNYPEADTIVARRRTKWGWIKRIAPYSLAAYLIALFVCGYLGFKHLQLGETESSHIFHNDFQAVWSAFELPLGNTLSKDTQSEPNRVPVILTAAKFMGVTFAFGALLVITWRTVRKPFKRFRIWLIRYMPVDYDIICGMGWKGYELAKDLRSNPAYRKRRLLVIDTNPENPYIKEFQDDLNVVFIQGDATRQHSLTEAGLYQANTIYILNDEDELNSRITRQVDNLLRSKKRPAGKASTPCYVHIKDPRIRANLEDSTNCASENPACNVMTFNVEENTVRRLLMEYPVAPVDEPEVDETHTHLVIFGDSSVGHALFVEQLRTLHLHKKHKIHLTWYLETQNGEDSELAAKIRSIYARLPFLNPNWEGDASWSPAERTAFKVTLEDTFPYVFREGESETLIEFQAVPTSDSGIRSRSHTYYDSLKKGWNLHLYVCLDDGVRSAAYGAVLQDGLDAMLVSLGEPGIQTIKFGQHPEDSKGSEKSENWALNFGEYSEECAMSVLRNEWIDPQAQLIDLFYRIKYALGDDKYQKAARAELLAEVSRSDDFRRSLQEVWCKKHEWARESNRQCAAHLIVKFRMLGIHPRSDTETQRDYPDDEGRLSIVEKLGLGEIEQIEKRLELSYFPAPLPSESNEVLEAMSDLEHRRWNAERLLHGWLPSFNEGATPEETKQYKNVWHLHYDLRPYSELKEDVKDYDRFIISNLTLVIGHPTSKS